ncbi:biotin--[acetyl-CoA-carboxylase] ligase [Cognatiluteimonas weifangensis]|uniref:biotin--[acetyl-CoA-carboxylase] ligase n=1 Tax=Cognatiluteimonas weifangensis TaxID=2303539 RepID=UPI001F459476|nr:biotin--[acetyl-CoA-carboxylase] ligase [Luteimonas weifangensis]
MNERDLLVRLLQGPASGAALARAAGQTRAAIWKHVQALRAAGVAIAVQPGRGYTLAQPLQLLDAKAILAQLAPVSRAAIATLDVAWSLDSTNSELLRRPPPAHGAAVLLAERQSGGRGRRGRHWVSPLAANLYLSLARNFGGGLARLPGLSLVAGIASAEALHTLGFKQVRLKWPNDLVVADAAATGPESALRKLGGLLTEGGGEVAGPARAVLGLGLNVAMPAGAMAAIAQPWTDLATLAGGAVPARNTLAAALLTHWLPALADFDAHGLAPFLPRYARLDALAGREVLLHAEGGTRCAHALGLAADGALRVRIGAVEHSVHAGEVSVRAA